MSNESFDFLCTPYSHPSPEVRIARYRVARDLTAGLMKEGRRVFSPIVHNHHIATINSMGFSAYDWEDFNDPFLRNCRRVLVALVDGLSESKGVEREIQAAWEYEKEIEYIDLTAYGL